MAKSRVGGRTYVTFIVDSSDIKQEFRKFAKGLSLEVSKEIKSTQTHNKIIGDMGSRLKGMYPSRSGRISAIMKTLGKGRSVKQRPHSSTLQYVTGRKSASSGPPLVGRLKSLDVHMSLVSIKDMNERTRISTLDAKFRPKHKAAFASPANPPKRIGSPSSHRYSLWSILEHRNKKTYPITGHDRLLAFTQASDGYSKWHKPSRVMWKASGASTKAHYILNSMRDMYKQDKDKFKRSVVSGVSKYITTKSRFRK